MLDVLRLYPGKYGREHVLVCELLSEYVEMRWKGKNE